jgi:hypothetical protein
MIYWHLLFGCTDEEVAGHLLRCYEDYKSLEKMSRHLGVARETLRIEMHKRGLALRKRGGKYEIHQF